MERRQFLKLGITALAATALSLEQINSLLEQSRGPEIIGIDAFEKYVVSEMNKLPEKDVGRVVKIESVRSETSFMPVMRGLNVNKYYTKAKYWSCQYDPYLISKIEVRKEFIKNAADQLRFAWNR